MLVLTENVDSRHIHNMMWINNSFMKMLRFVNKLSSYPHLNSLYKILASLAVTSSSAERVLSRVRIIKNRLRTPIADDWFCLLTIESVLSHSVSRVSEIMYCTPPNFTVTSQGDQLRYCLGQSLGDSTIWKGSHRFRRCCPIANVVDPLLLLSFWFLVSSRA